MAQKEDVYLRGYASMGELQQGLTAYFAFYNHERPHQALDYKTPSEVYRDAVGGGAMILDRYGHHTTVGSNATDLTVSGQRCSAANRAECVS